MGWLIRSTVSLLFFYAFIAGCFYFGAGGYSDHHAGKVAVGKLNGGISGFASAVWPDSW